MTIYMIASTIALLLLTPHQPTTLQFTDQIEYYAIGHTSDFDSYLSKDKKILLLNPKKEHFDEFLVVITKGKSYQFQVRNTAHKRTGFYKILMGKKDKFYSLKKKTNSYKVFEGPQSIKIERLKAPHLMINGRKVSEKSFYYPKNAPLFINGEEV